MELDKFRAVFNLTKHFVSLWNGGSSYSGKPDFYSYLITDKNKYKPGETVRFKSYALSRYKRALRQELSLWLRTGGQHPFKKIRSVNPYHPRGFAGKFQLVDSLELKLGQRYSMQFRDARERVVATTEFVYEDYELSGNKLQLNLESHTHYFPNKSRLNICATEVNGLPLRETVVDVTVRRQEVLKSYSELLVLPDTLMAMQVELDALGKATVDIPSNLFGASNCVYNVEVVLYTLDNQRLEQRSEATFYHSCYEIRNTIQGDTLCLSLFDLEEERLMEALLDYGGKKKKKIHLPFPAGCSYDSKPVYTSGCEVYREYFKEKTVIFSERLPIGTYRFNIPLLPRYTGKYTLNPAKVELMYFPVINANNSKKGI